MCIRDRIIIASMLVPHSPLLNLALQLSLTLSVASLLAAVSAAILLFRLRSARPLIYSLAIHLYWCLLSLLALKSCLDIIMRTPRKWVTTPKEGLYDPETLDPKGGDVTNVSDSGRLLTALHILRRYGSELAESIDNIVARADYARLASDP